MAKKFNYDIYSLIEIIESKECLWDKTKDVNKDKIRRKNAWRICIFLEPNFDYNIMCLISYMFRFYSSAMAMSLLGLESILMSLAVRPPCGIFPVLGTYIT